jgi:hypothetical protein
MEVNRTALLQLHPPNAGGTTKTTTNPFKKGKEEFLSFRGACLVIG